MKKLIVLLALSLTTSVFAHKIPGVTDERVITRDGKKVELLTNAKGLSLYTFDPDGADESNCYDSCAVAWPPILLTAEQVKLVKSPFGLVKRTDGTIQLSFDTHPLYLYVSDKKPGDIKGDGLGGVWHLAIDEE